MSLTFSELSKYHDSTSRATRRFEAIYTKSRTQKYNEDIANMAVENQSPPIPALQRKQLKDGMEHLRGFVTLDTAPQTQPQETTSGATEGKGEGEDTYGVPSALAPVRKPKTNETGNPEKRTDPFQFGSRYLEEGDDIFAFNAWDHVETDEAYRSFAEECYQRQREAPVSEFDRSTYVLSLCMGQRTPAVGE